MFNLNQMKQDDTASKILFFYVLFERIDLYYSKKAGALLFSTRFYSAYHFIFTSHNSSKFYFSSFVDIELILNVLLLNNDIDKRKVTLQTGISFFLIFYSFKIMLFSQTLILLSIFFLATVVEDFGVGSGFYIFLELLYNFPFFYRIYQPFSTKMGTKYLKVKC